MFVPYALQLKDLTVNQKSWFLNRSLTSSGPPTALILQQGSPAALDHIHVRDAAFPAPVVLSSGTAQVDHQAQVNYFWPGPADQLY